MEAVGGVAAQRVHRAMKWGNGGCLRQLAIFLPIQTLLTPHNVDSLRFPPTPAPQAAQGPKHRNNIVKSAHTTNTSAACIFKSRTVSPPFLAMTSLSRAWSRSQ